MKMSASQSHREQDLLRLLRQGDEAAFSIFYEEYKQAVQHFLIKFIKSPELAEDISQEIFMQIWESHKKLEEVHSLKAWLFTIARNRAYNFLKRAAVDGVAKGEILRNYPLSDLRTEDELLTQEYMQYIQKVIADMPEQTSRVFKLCREEHKSYDEVAEILGVTRHAVKKHMVKSMKILKGAVEKDLGISLTVLLTILYQH